MLVAFCIKERLSNRPTAYKYLELVIERVDDHIPGCSSRPPAHTTTTQYALPQYFLTLGAKKKTWDFFLSTKAKKDPLSFIFYHSMQGEKPLGAGFYLSFILCNFINALLCDKPMAVHDPTSPARWRRPQLMKGMVCLSLASSWVFGVHDVGFELALSSRL